MQAATGCVRAWSMRILGCLAPDMQRFSPWVHFQLKSSLSTEWSSSATDSTQRMGGSCSHAKLAHMFPTQPISWCHALTPVSDDTSLGRQTRSLSAKKTPCHQDMSISQYGDQKDTLANIQKGNGTNSTLVNMFLWSKIGKQENTIRRGWVLKDSSPRSANSESNDAAPVLSPLVLFEPWTIGTHLSDFSQASLRVSQDTPNRGHRRKPCAGLKNASSEVCARRSTILEKTFSVARAGSFTIMKLGILGLGHHVYGDTLNVLIDNLLKSLVSSSFTTLAAHRNTRKQVDAMLAISVSCW